MCKRLEAILADEDYATLVACNGEEIVGFLGTRIGPALVADGACCCRALAGARRTQVGLLREKLRTRTKARQPPHGSSLDWPGDTATGGRFGLCELPVFATLHHLRRFRLHDGRRHAFTVPKMYSFPSPSGIFVLGTGCGLLVIEIR